MVTSEAAGEQAGAAQLRRWTLRNRPPENEMPGALALDRVIGRTEDLAVILVGGRVYSTGIHLEVLVLQNRPDDSWDDDDSSDADDALSEQAFADEASSASGTALLLGVQYPDGRTTTNLRAGRHTFGAHDDEEDQTLRLQAGGGGGGRGNVRMSFWLSPPPPDGDVLVVCAWPHRGIDETRTVVAGREVDRARRHNSELWPWEPEPEPAQRQPPAPPVLPPGWFAEAWKNQEQS